MVIYSMFYHFRTHQFSNILRCDHDGSGTNSYAQWVGQGSEVLLWVWV